MVSMANLNIPERAIRHQIANAVHAVVQVARLSDGSRKIITVSEVTGMEGDMIRAAAIFSFSTAAASTKTARCAESFIPPATPAFRRPPRHRRCRLSPALFESRMEV